MWHLSARLSVARNRPMGKSDGLCQHDHARHGEIEGQWNMVAFDTAIGPCLKHTGPVVFTHEGRSLSSCREGRRSELIDLAEDVGEQARGITTSAICKTM